MFYVLFKICSLICIYVKLNMFLFIYILVFIEFTTPTFNLTSTPKNRRSVARKVNVDISDPIFKLPFEHGK